jgi:hypothetical protein
MTTTKINGATQVQPSSITSGQVNSSILTTGSSGMVTLANMADLPADKVIGRRTSTGVPQAIDATFVLDMIGVTHGSILHKTTIWETLPIGATGSVLTTVFDGVYHNPEWVMPFIPKWTFVRDVKTSGTNGGTFTSGAWRTRDLNEINTDSPADITLASNQLTFSAGTYMIQARCPAANVTFHQAMLYSITSSQTLKYGSNAYCSTSLAETDSVLHLKITFGTSHIVELRHRCSSTSSVNGYGAACSFGGDEVYSTLVIQRLA